jgi:hypothetical protein
MRRQQMVQVAAGAIGLVVGGAIASSLGQETIGIVTNVSTMDPTSMVVTPHTIPASPLLVAAGSVVGALDGTALPMLRRLHR